MPGTLADLVGGFQQGYTGVQDARRKRKLNRAIDYELEGMEQKRNAGNAGIARLGYGDEMSAPNFQMPQTYGERLVGKVKSFFSGGTGNQPTTAIDPAVQPAGAQASGATTYGMNENRYQQPRQYKDGGAVRHMANGGPAETPEEKRERYRRMTEEGRNAPTDGGGFLAGAKDVGRAITGLPARAFPNTTRELKDNAGMEAIRRGDVVSAEGPEAKGRAVRDYAGEAVHGAARAVGAFADDALGPIDEAIGYGGRMIKGALGMGGDGAQAPTRAIDPESPAAASAEEAAVTSAVAAQPAGAPPNTQTPQAKLAAEPAGPPDEIIDFTQVRDIMPEDLPAQTVKDWEDERRFWAAQAIAMGNDPHAAMQAVTDRQMTGFNTYGQQAFQMLNMGDATGAARALYAAYQYFPNGADVRFGVQKGVDGQPVLIGMGTDEETGEPIKEGRPVVITPESLSAQMQNMSDPNAWNTWVKDQTAVMQEMREYNEVTKPEAESNARYRDRMGEAALTRADAEYNRSIGADGSGGMKKADFDRANSAFQKAVELESFENEEQADFMMSLMADIYDQVGGNVQYPTVIADVRTAIRSGDFTELDQKYGQ